MCILCKESLFVQWFIDLQTKHCSKVTSYYYHYILTGLLHPAAIHWLHCLHATEACECSPFIAATRAVTRALAANQRSVWPGPDQSEAGAGHGQASEPSPGGPGQWPLTRLEAAEDLSHRQERGNLGHHGYTGCCFNICDYNNKLTKKLDKSIVLDSSEI